jgi:DNA-binding NarL/FixJ family response regulator
MKHDASETSMLNRAVPTILVLDGHPAMRDILSLVLERRGGWRVCGKTGNAEEAISLASYHRPRAAIVGTAGSRGQQYDLIAKLSQVCPETAIVAVSAWDDADSVERCLRAGARTCISNDGSTEILLSAVRPLVESPFRAKEVAS